MSILSRLERRFGRLAVPNVTMALIVGQVLVYGLAYVTPDPNQPAGVPGPNLDVLMKLSLIPAQVLSGEVWRLVTFLFVPPTHNLIFAIFFWYLFYLMGTALEQSWGVFRYNVYLLLGYAATVAVSFATPAAAATNGYLQASVFLAFAFLYPNFELMLFFILPVRIKWLALLTWIGYFLTFAFGGWTQRLVILAAVGNFLLFFGRDIVRGMKSGHRRMNFQAKQAGSRKKIVHRCAICGISSETHPGFDFRYCSKCDGNHCYCPDHLRNHEHVVAEAEDAPDRQR